MKKMSNILVNEKIKLQKIYKQLVNEDKKSFNPIKEHSQSLQELFDSFYNSQIFDMENLSKYFGNFVHDFDHIDYLNDDKSQFIIVMRGVLNKDGKELSAIFKKAYQKRILLRAGFKGAICFGRSAEDYKSGKNIYRIFVADNINFKEDFDKIFSNPMDIILTIAPNNPDGVFTNLPSVKDFKNKSF